jgi:O-antigen/teichoic acid export membrane protein
MGRIVLIIISALTFIALQMLLIYRYGWEIYSMSYLYGGLVILALLVLFLILYIIAKIKFKLRGRKK